MNYVSTRNTTQPYTAAQAIAQGLALDGGLLTPEVMPKLPENALNAMISMTYEQRAVYVMGAFLADFTEAELTDYAKKAYGGGKFDVDAVAPVRTLDDATHCLELWHGPTCAFKDMALQMLPHLLTASLKKTDEDKTVCILVATSGDTGKAALEGFKDVDQTKILVFYPGGGVSDVQKLQMQTQEGANVGVSSVVGNFDDAQTGVKRLFSDEALRQTLNDRGYFFSSANSINWGRILPQVVYYVSAYCDLVRDGKVAMGEQVNFCVPTGNFGNILSAYYAGLLGVPVGKLICASNENNVLTDFIKTGIYDRNRPFHTTTSPSMDILISSNLERMLFAFSNQNAVEVKGYMDALNSCGRYEVSADIKAKLDAHFAAGYCGDKAAGAMIDKLWQDGYLIDTHTAVAFHVLEQYRSETGDQTPTVVVSTASPFKFCDSVLEAIGVTDLKGGLSGIDQLSDKTGAVAPTPLAGLKGKAVRFDSVTTKEEMVDKVLEMLQ